MLFLGLKTQNDDRKPHRSLTPFAARYLLLHTLCSLYRIVCVSVNYCAAHCERYVVTWVWRNALCCLCSHWNVCVNKTMHYSARCKRYAITCARATEMIGRFDTQPCRPSKRWSKTPSRSNSMPRYCAA
jgi:hypothetical protein